MKTTKILVMILSVLFAGHVSFSQNVSINIQSQNAGQINLGQTGFIELRIANTSSSVTGPVNKVRPQISVPGTQLEILPNASQSLPAGWTIISNTTNTIRYSNTTDALEPNSVVTILVAVSVKSPLSAGNAPIQGQIFFNGPATTGNSATDDLSSTAFNVNDACPSATTRLYVDKEAFEGGSGSSWSCAIKELSNAITIANANPLITSIWVANGMYKPTTGTDRNATMAITRANLTILGGFAGGEANASDANPLVNFSIVSGDIGSTGVTSDNSYHLFTINSLPASQPALVVNGLIFENGNANGLNNDTKGGAVYSVAVPATTPVQILNSVFRNNNASLWGGALYLYQAGFSFDNCRFASNTSGVYGGALFTFQSPSRFNQSVFVGNSSDKGGAFYANFGLAQFNKTVFTGNNATYGGGVYQAQSNADYFNCVFNANTSFQGGAIYEHNFAFSHILNSTFFKNSGASYGGTVVLNYNSTTKTENSIFWKNTHAGSATSPWADFVNYTATGANVYANNILQLNTAIPADNGTTRKFNKRGVDPLFTNELSPVGADVLWGTADDGLQLQNCAAPSVANAGVAIVPTACSPAINAGDNAPVTAASLTTDERNNPRIVCSIVDMGAYENQNCGVPTLAEQEVVSMVKAISTNSVTGIVANPISNNLQIRYTSAEKASIVVYAESGKTIWSKNNISEGITNADASSWARGIYQVVIVTANGKRLNFKVVKM